MSFWLIQPTIPIFTELSPTDSIQTEAWGVESTKGRPSSVIRARDWAWARSAAGSTPNSNVNRRSALREKLTIRLLKTVELGMRM